ncbi:MAG TPA: hypothetical protein VMV98_01190 [Acidobacteriaceae bacterium]|nr:hypothetical protein [Acidobacteriaceae bacterium]
MKSGDRPRDPHCALDTVVNPTYREYFVKWCLCNKDRHLLIWFDDPDLTTEQRNSAIWLGQQIYPKERGV